MFRRTNPSSWNWPRTRHDLADGGFMVTLIYLDLNGIIWSSIGV
jgi:hypothetical protein